MKKNKKQLWIVKAGSAMVVQGGPLLIKAWAAQIAELKRNHVQVVWVSSGAIATGARRIQRKWQTLPEKQALSAIGQPAVVDLYNLALQSEGLQAAQVLITYDDMKQSKRKKNLHNTLKTLLDWGVVPVINENDTVATEEIQFGDNDGLAAKLAIMMQADRLVILTDVDGLYTDDPKKNPQAQLIAEVKKWDKKIFSGLEKVKKQADPSSLGRGGMLSKVSAARSAQKKGIQAHLLKGDHPQGLVGILKNQNIGTRIVP